MSDEQQHDDRADDETAAETGESSHEPNEAEVAKESGDHATSGETTTTSRRPLIAGITGLALIGIIIALIAVLTSDDKKKGDDVTATATSTSTVGPSGATVPPGPSGASGPTTTLATRDVSTLADYPKNAGPNKGDYFRVALGLNLCGTAITNDAIRPFNTPEGIEYTGDGLMHYHPYTDAVTKDNGNLQAFFTVLGISLTSQAMDILSDGVTLLSGRACPEQTPAAGKASFVRLFVDGKEYKGDPALYVPKDGESVMVAYIPADADPGEVVSKAALSTPKPQIPVAPTTTTALPETTSTQRALTAEQQKCAADPAPKAPDTRPSFTKAPDRTIDAAKTYRATLETSCGKIVLELDAKSAPNTVNNFVFLARQGFFNAVPFHRVVNTFVIQTGDPTGTGTGGPGYTFNDELPTAGYDIGSVAMANSGPNTNGSQFFIVTGTEGANLNKNYSKFGKVVEGLEVAKLIESFHPDGDGGDGPPIRPLYLKSVTIEER